VSADLAALAADIQILPEEFTLRDPAARQRISVVRTRDQQVAACIPTGELSLISSDPQVVRIEDDHVVAVGNGTAIVVAWLQDGTTATATVRVQHDGRHHPPSFRNDVQSIFSRVGCNAGACHGALAGKGGFRLSLGAYDPQLDYRSITREAHGRRIEIGDPGQSLLLAKPTAAVPHKGGLKLDPDSRNYEILAAWVAAGAPGPQADDPRLQRISVMPATSLLAPGDASQVLVRAHYDDGREVDVTHWARFTATDEAIAGVDEHGHVSVRGSGEGAVLVWFGSKVALARITVPFANEVSAEEFAAADRRNFIDDLSLQQLQTLKLRPSPRCDDEEFLRRATLDTVGRLPTPQQRTDYLAQPAPERRDWLIERLLASEEFVDYWTYRISDLLVINGNRLRPVGVKTYYQWVRDSVAQNKPWDQLVREILTATGESDEQGPTNFFALNQSPEEMTENACQAFLGLSIGCAKCHNHPLEKWTNDQYYSMANLFARVRAKGWGGAGVAGDGLRTLYVASSGDLIQPRRGKPQPPAPLDAQPLSFDDPSDRREALAQWLTDPANPYFARAISNRIWANFFGRGLVEPVDDLRISNPASNEPLLQAAAQHLVDGGFDLKLLMRTILQSATYHRSSVPLEENRADTRYLSRYYPRRLMAEVLLDSIDQVLGTSTKFDEIALPGASKEKTDFYAEGTRAIQLYDAAVDSYFLKTFGRNPREITCECERSDQPSMIQALHLSNGNTLNTKLADPDNRIAQAIKQQQQDPQVVDALFLAALTRLPTPAERDELLSVIGEYGEDRATALQDAAWGILTSPEFTFNH
jgi:hypothetical protein